MAPRAKYKKCVLCEAKLTPSKYDGLFLHTGAGRIGTCAVKVTDHLGLSVDDDYEVIEGEIYARMVDEAVPEAIPTLAVLPSTTLADGGTILTFDTPYKSADFVSRLLFEQAGLPNLGGMSGIYGWSSISTFQQCRHLWNLKYGPRAEVRDTDKPAAEALEIGTLFHVLLAIHYSRKMDPAYPLTIDEAVKYMRAMFVTPAHMAEAERLYSGYAAYYGDEPWMEVLAVEHLAVDPRDGMSCRWDLVFRLNEPYEHLLPGVFVCNSKSASSNSMTDRAQWQNDGQILGEINLYERLGYHRLWGPLRGACINRAIKTKVPQYDRVWVYPPKSVLRDHRKSLQVWRAEMDLAVAHSSFPKSRAACVNRYRMLCDKFYDCAGADETTREIEE